MKKKTTKQLLADFFGYKNKYEALESDHSAQVTREVNIRPNKAYKVQELLWNSGGKTIFERYKV